MKNWRAIWAAMALWAFFGWCYIIARILTGIDPRNLFIDEIPIMFGVIGIGFFILGFIGTVGALRDG